jgi:hypothetical protein
MLNSGDFSLYKGKNLILIDCMSFSLVVNK